MPSPITHGVHGAPLLSGALLRVQGVEARGMQDRDADAPVREHCRDGGMGKSDWVFLQPHCPECWKNRLQALAAQSENSMQKTIAPPIRPSTLRRNCTVWVPHGGGEAAVGRGLGVVRGELEDGIEESALIQGVRGA